MEHVDVRLETTIKAFIEDLSNETDRVASEIARDLAWVGIGIQKEGGIYIVGLFGVSRPLAELDLGDKKKKVAFWIGEELVKQLEAEFGESVRSALRKAIRLGILTLKSEVAKIRGPFGFERPLLRIDMSKLKDERAREAYNRLRSNKIS